MVLIKYWRSDGKKHGKGVYKFNTKDLYEGYFVDGKRHGKGRFQLLIFRYTWNTGELYVGDWKNDQMSGQG